MTGKLRSARWFDTDDLRGFGHRSRLMQMGYGLEDWNGRPVIAIMNTWSDINPCHAHFRHRVEDVKRGILQAGGFPVELPALSLSENFVKPTTMLYRNLLAIETEELLRSHPVDGAVLMGGCDKTMPGLLLGAISMDLPCLFLPAGPMLRGNLKGEILGSGSDTWKYWDERRAGRIGREEWQGVEAGIARSYGHCMTMGTAATMTAIADAMGMCLTGASSIPAPDSNHIRMAAATGRRAVELVLEDLRPSRVLSAASFANSLNVAMAMGCSTNAIIHLIALSRRAGHPLTLEDFHAAGRRVPVLANIRPSGERYLMEDFYYAGGLRALMAQMGHLLDGTARTVTGKILGDEIKGAEVYLPDVIRGLDNPVSAEPAMAVLRGNLAPDGAVIKPSAADPRLLEHRGPALVFDSYADMKARIDDPDLDVTADAVLVMRGAGPQGGPGMPEWGMLPIPQKLLRYGVRDMLRISDARMSGTSYGACILHVAPEAHVGGPLALVRTGDRIRVDVRAGLLEMEVGPEDLARRRAEWVPPSPRYERGYGWAFTRHVMQADQGCDFDFLATGFGAAVAEPEIL
ncbi:L-arabinonate dehydratase [Roseibium salinum]|uniref:L-arabinonate dehydratase n=1 Tax=Roseibium salinum TaxID=1604349 RepID=A0ABT3QVV4_9HYPH|nr:L-arabinonate dehydratase [Roseibium sp. DSM 29163]MCX2721059.1 L-arabinonate dehydratase [Roseibium sp. DSM 29163]